jgi:Flp pilus assembly pilin Flp
MNALLKKLWMEEEGGEGLEYPFVIAMIILAALATWLLLGPEILRILNLILGALQEVG